MISIESSDYKLLCGVHAYLKYSDEKTLLFSQQIYRKSIWSFRLESIDEYLFHQLWLRLAAYNHTIPDLIKFKIEKEE